MRAGELRNRVTIEQPVVGADGQPALDPYGTPVVAWETFANRWAMIERLQGRELEYARQTVATVSHRVTVRPEELDGINTKMRVNDGGTLLNIEAVLDATKPGGGLVLLCVEKA